MKIYVASSWRNTDQQKVVKGLRDAGFEVYDFKNPTPKNTGFKWSDISPNWKSWKSEDFVRSLDHPIAAEGFESDWKAMLDADACVLLMPCGRSAHLEAGYFVGAKKKLVICTDNSEPELMYKMASLIVTDIKEIVPAMLLLERASDIEKRNKRS